MLRKSRIGNLITLLLCAGFVIGMAGCEQPKPVHTHTFSNEWKTDAKYHWHAANCEHTTEVSGKTDHQFSETWKLVTAATEKKEGLEECFCEICNYRVTRVIPMLEHKHDIAKEWTMTETKHWHAASCDREEHNEDVGEHIEDAGTVTKPANYSEDGIKTFKCETCGKEMRTEVLPALELTEINKDGWLIKISNVPEGVKFEITKPSTVKSIDWAAIDKLSNDAAGRYEATGVINLPEFIKDTGTSTFVFPFVNPDENTKLHIRINSDIGILEEKLYIKTSGGMGCPDYKNALPENNKMKININKDKMSAVIEKFVMPDFSNVKLQIEPDISMVEIYKNPDWTYFTGDYKAGWDAVNFELKEASEKIPFGESYVLVNYIRAFKIVDDTSYHKYFSNFRLATLTTTADISEMYIAITDMAGGKGRRYKSIEKKIFDYLPEGTEAYILVKISDFASGYKGVTSGVIWDFSKVSDIATKWDSIKQTFPGKQEFNDEKYTMTRLSEETEEVLRNRKPKALPDFSKIMFIDEDITYTAVPY